MNPNSLPRWPSTRGACDEPDAVELADTPTLYARHAGFVWRSLAHLGIAEADREDLLQEVFVIVHRTRDSYEGRGQLTSWLYGIALRVASRHRRRERVRAGKRNDSTAPSAELRTPEHELVLRQRAHLLHRILAQLPEPKREVFVMFEIQGMSTEQIANVLNVPRGTIFSRLHSAREIFMTVWRELEVEEEGAEQ